MAHGAASERGCFAFAVQAAIRTSFLRCLRRDALPLFHDKNMQVQQSGVFEKVRFDASGSLCAKELRECAC